MTLIERRFAHIPTADRDAAVAGFTRLNPHLRGIDFDTMMEMILDADEHLPIIGDVPVRGEAATSLVKHFANVRVVRNASIWPPNHGLDDEPGWLVDIDVPDWDGPRRVADGLENTYMWLESWARARGVKLSVSFTGLLG
jgi:hypothetical protein